MRIYAVADIHGKSQRIETIKTVIQHEEPDIVVIAGDITHYFFPRQTLAQITSIPVPVFCVRGNSDLKPVETHLRNQHHIRLLTPDPVTFQAVTLVGLNGTLALPFLSKVSMCEAKKFKSIQAKITPETILVTHPPPRGVCDRVGNQFHAGSFQLKQFIDTHPPLILLCGHIHEQAGFQYLKKTLVVNCAMNKHVSGAIIDYGKGKPPKIKMIPNNERQK